MRALVVWATILCFSTAIAAPLTTEQREEARKHWDSANRKFDLGKYDEAATEFETVYEISGDTSLLFNIAQAMRLARNYERAQQFYRSYLRKAPEGKYRALVEKRVAEMAELIEQQKSVSSAPPQGTIQEEKPQRAEPPPTSEQPAATTEKPVETTTPATTPPPRSPPPRGLRYAGFALGGLAIASLAVGAAFSALASSANDDIARANQAHNMTWTPALRDEDANARTYDSVAIGMYVGAGALAVASAVTLALGYRRPHEERSAKIRPLLGPHVAGVSVGGSF
jgi:hypothetical protein